MENNHGTIKNETVLAADAVSANGTRSVAQVGKRKQAINLCWFRPLPQRAIST
jgi:hypothetical protein